jgi:anaerobic selenocysteine-containing dehydrogenase
MTTTAYATCPLCEATCGLELTLDGDRVSKVRGDDQDVFSHGFICPKGASIGALHSDPDRLRAPLVAGAPATWDEAFAYIDERLGPIIEEHGRDAVGIYVGNPTAHNLASLLYGRVFQKAVGTRNIFTASTVDQMPKHVSAGLMFGAPLSIPIPDLDRTSHLLMLGANPMASNGSLMTAPDARGRLRAIRERGGKVVVVDPRRTRTAEIADEWIAIRPGTDALLLMAMAGVLFDEGLVAPGRLEPMLSGVEAVGELAEPFTPEAVEAACGVPAETIRRMARELAAADRAAVYGRIGTCTQEFGTLASWLVDVLNALTGNLDREGGAMFPLAAVGQTNSTGRPGSGRGLAMGRWSSRVRGAREIIGELPVSCMAEEIETPGEGQIRALITMAGNPCLSTPDAARLDRAMAGLDLVISLDVYVNETTRHADVILPGPSPLARSHYDLAFYQLSVRNVVNYTPALLESPVRQEWESLLRMTGIVTGQGPNADIEALDRFVALAIVQQETGREGSAWHGRDPEEVLAEAGARRGPERLLDLLLRAGPYDLTLADLEAAPHGIDLGPLQPRLPDALRTPSGMVELAPDLIAGDVPRLRASLDRARNGAMVLIGRRHLRSNNSWMHNVEPLVRGKDRCTALVHPDDAARLGLADGALARVRSRAGEVEVPVEVSDEMMPGVVSIPHGWGHAAEGVRMEVARRHPGVNVNVLADGSVTDPLSGNAVLNGIPVEMEPVGSNGAAAAAGAAAATG